MPKLKNLQYEIFAQEYSVSNHGTNSAIKAKYSKKSAAAQATRLLKIAKIKDRIDELLTQTTDKLQITRERIMAEYAKLAFLNPKKFYNTNGTVKKIHSMDDDTAAAITSIETLSLGNKKKYGRITKIKASDKRGALDSLAKAMGMFTEKHEHSGPGGKPLVDERELAARIAFALRKAKNV